MSPQPKLHSKSSCVIRRSKTWIFALVAAVLSYLCYPLPVRLKWHAESDVVFWCVPSSSAAGVTSAMFPRTRLNHMELDSMMLREAGIPISVTTASIITSAAGFMIGLGEKENRGELRGILTHNQTRSKENFQNNNISGGGCCQIHVSFCLQGH